MGGHGHRRGPRLRRRFGGDQAARQHFAVGQGRCGRHRPAAPALDADAKELRRPKALDQDIAAGARQRPVAGADQDRCVLPLDEVDVNRHLADSLEPGKQAAEPALLLLLDDRRIADVRRLAQRGVLPQALRFLRRIDLDILGVRLAPVQQLVDEALVGGGVVRVLIDLAADVGWARRGRSPAAARPGRRSMLPCGAFSAVCGTSASSACCRSLCSCGRGAPGRGGRRL